jgi:hypothetical protein
MEHAETPAGRGVDLWRAGWIAAALLVVALYCASLPSVYTGLLHARAPAMRAALASLHVSAGAYAVYVVLLGLAGALGYWLLALVILARAGASRPAPLIAFILVAFGAALPGTTYALATQTPLWDVPYTLLQVVGWAALLLFAFVFPDGRFAAPGSRLVLVVGGIWVGAFFLAAGWLARRSPGWIAVTLVIWVAWFAAGVLAQGYRYIFAATSTQRQQTKWVVLGFVLAITGALVAVVPHALLLTLPHPTTTLALVQLALMPVMTVAVFAIPGSVAIAILRHQLFDIDFIIRRTLVYGTLTVTLVTIFATCETVASEAVGALGGSLGGPATTAPAVVVLSTLTVSALFRPVHHRVQMGIDQRFYRSKYNAERAMAGFMASLRTEFDLEQVERSLLHVVERTMEPEHASLWLRRPAAATRRDDAPTPHT